MAGSHGPFSSFLYFWAQMKNAGHAKVTNDSVAPMRRATGMLIYIKGYTARDASTIVRSVLAVVDDLSCIRCLKRGKRTKTSTEKSIRAKTERLERKREAKTTLAEMAAFIERTEVKRSLLAKGLAAL